MVPDVVSYNAAISACGRAQQWEKALELLVTMEERGLVPTLISYSAAIGACKTGQQYAKALELVQTMERRGIKLDVRACDLIDQCEEALCSEQDAQGCAVIELCEKAQSDQLFAKHGSVGTSELSTDGGVASCDCE